MAETLSPQDRDRLYAQVRAARAILALKERMKEEEE